MNANSTSVTDDADDGAAAARGILADGFGRIRELVSQLTAGLGEDLATYRPDSRANSIT